MGNFYFPFGLFVVVVLSFLMLFVDTFGLTVVIETGRFEFPFGCFVIVVLAGTLVVIPLLGRFLVDAIGIAVVDELGRFEFPLGVFVVVVFSGALVKGLLGTFLVDAIGFTVVVEVGNFEFPFGFFVVVVLPGPLVIGLLGRFLIDALGFTVEDEGGFFWLLADLFGVPAVGLFDDADECGFDSVIGTFSSAAVEMIVVLVDFFVTSSEENGIPFTKITNESKNTRKSIIFEKFKLNFYINEPN